MATTYCIDWINVLLGGGGGALVEVGITASA